MVILTEGWIPTGRRHTREKEGGEKELGTFAPAAQRGQRMGRLKEEATRRRKKRGTREEDETRRKAASSLQPELRCARVCPTKIRQRGTAEYTHYRTLFFLFPSLVALVPLIIMHFVQRRADGDAVGVRPADLRHRVVAVRSVVACIDSGYI